MIFEDIAKKENLYNIANALENDSEECCRTEEEILKKLLNELNTIEQGEVLKNDFIDLFAMTSLNSYIKGMKMGARMYALLKESSVGADLK